MSKYDESFDCLNSKIPYLLDAKIEGDPIIFTYDIEWIPSPEEKNNDRLNGFSFFQRYTLKLFLFLIFSTVTVNAIKIILGTFKLKVRRK